MKKRSGGNFLDRYDIKENDVMSDNKVETELLSQIKEVLL